MKAATQDWYKLAAKDYQAAESLINQEGLENIVLFLCQQCIEKMLKSFLIEYDAVVPRIHNTYNLYRKVAKVHPITIDAQYLMELDSIYTSSRYPSHLGMLPSGYPSAEYARVTLTNTEEYFNQLTSELKKL